MKRLKDYIVEERRSGQDRRQSYRPFYMRRKFKLRRQSLRRTEDSRRVAVLDKYHPPLLLFILIILGLSLSDAVLTLIILERGAVELNPIMRFYIDLGPRIFVIVKYGLTALALVLMVLLNVITSTRPTSVSIIRIFCGLAFGSVVIWELYLLTNFSPV